MSRVKQNTNFFTNLKPAVLYIRVSSKEQEREGFSLPAQLKFLHDYATSNGYTVVHEYRDVETAKQSGRTYFNEMVSFLRLSKSNSSKVKLTPVIIVEKTDRLYRNIKDWITIDELDTEVHFAKENFILTKDSKSSEKFLHGIKVLMAKNYIDNLSEEVKKGMTEKAATGIWPSVAPYGYINVTQKDEKRL